MVVMESLIAPDRKSEKLPPGTLAGVMADAGGCRSHLGGGAIGGGGCGGNGHDVSFRFSIRLPGARSAPVWECP